MPERVCSWHNTKTNPDGEPEDFVDRSFSLNRVEYILHEPAENT